LKIVTCRTAPFRSPMLVSDRRDDQPVLRVAECGLIRRRMLLRLLRASGAEDQ